MSLLLLFGGQVAPSASGDVVTSLLVETTTGTWYDATSDLISGTVSRGKQEQLDQYQAGVATVVLDNDDRKYDPTYAASPLNGHILPRKRIQLRDTYAGITYPRFTGYADRWTQNRPGPHRGTTTLAASDGLSVLARAMLASSAFAQEVVADNPVAWWRFDDDGQARDSIGTAHLTEVEGAPDYNTATLIAHDPGESVTFTSADGLYTAVDRFPLTGGPLTAEWVLSIASGTGTIGAMYDPDTNTGFALAADSTVGFQIGAGGSTAAAPATVDYTDGTTRHVVGVWQSDGAVKIYVDGVDRTSGSPTVTPVAFAASGFMSVGRFPFDLGGFTGIVDEFVVYDTALSAARIQAHYEQIATPWDGDLTGERIERLLDAVDWDAALRDIDTGTTTLQSAELDMSALEHAQKVAETEFGNFYVTAAGVARFEDRTSAVDQPVLFAFSDAAGAGLAITFSDPEISDELIRNDVTVSRLDGVAQNARDATSIAAYQTSSYVRDGLYHDDDDHSRAMAQFILQAYKDPVERVSTMSVNPYKDPATLWPAVLGLELTDRITLAETPQWVTPAVTRTLVVEGITHTFGPKSWEASFALSESTVQTQAYWQLGIAGYSELGETTRLFF